MIQHIKNLNREGINRWQLTELDFRSQVAKSMKQSSCPTSISHGLLHKVHSTAIFLHRNTTVTSPDSVPKRIFPVSNYTQRQFKQSNHKSISIINNDQIKYKNCQECNITGPNTIRTKHGSNILQKHFNPNKHSNHADKHSIQSFQRW